MHKFVIPLSAPEATDVGRFGPKAANQAALGQAGLPTPGGYCLDAEAYRSQLRALGLEETAREPKNRVPPHAGHSGLIRWSWRSP